MEKRIKRLGALVVLGMFVMMLFSPGAVAPPDDDTVVTALGNYIIKIDSDGDEDDRAFIVSHDVAGTGLFRIQETGEVGIGTPNPQTPLHVRTSSGDTRIRVERQLFSYMDIIADWDTCRLDCRNTYVDILEIQEDGTTRLKIKGGGNVGIGVTDPNGRLTINSDNTIELSFVTEASIPASTNIYANTGGDFYIRTIDSTALRLGTNNNDRICITSDGKVGIGTTIPQVALDVVSSDDVAIRVTKDGGWPYMDIISGDTFCALNIVDIYTATCFQIQEAGTPRLHIGHNIGVGIETTTPQSTLDVNGGLAINIVTKYHNDDGYTPTFWDYTILVDAESATEHLDIDLPAASYMEGKILVIKRIDDTSCGYDVKINADGSDIIDESSTKTLDSQWQSIMIQSNGSNWYILASGP
jgi:hypothetical protein